MTPTIPSPRHIGWIDYAKSAAIYLVVLLHTHCLDEITVAINGFVMPTFFFLSGYLFSRQRNPQFRPFALKRFRQLVVPYLWINIVAYLLWVTVLRNYGDDAGAGIGWHEPLVAVALGIPPGLTHDIPLWSLLCFFVVEMIYCLLSWRLKISDGLIAVAAYAVAAAISLLWPVEGVALPLALAPAAGGLAFYALGHLARSKSEGLAKVFAPSPLMLLLGVALLMLGLSLNVPTAFFLGALGYPLWFALSAMGGILITIQTALWLDRLLHDGALVRLMSRGTLLICGFHLPAFAVIKGVMLFGFGISPELLTAGPLRGIAMAAAACALCMPLIWVIERYFRFLVSK